MCWGTCVVNGKRCVWSRCCFTEPAFPWECAETFEAPSAGASMSCTCPQSSHDNGCLLTLCCLPLLTSDVYENVLSLWGGTETATPPILRPQTRGPWGSWFFYDSSSQSTLPAACLPVSVVRQVSWAGPHWVLSAPRMTAMGPLTWKEGQGYGYAWVVCVCLLFGVILLHLFLETPFHLILAKAPRSHWRHF